MRHAAQSSSRRSACCLVGCSTGEVRTPVTTLNMTTRRDSDSDSDRRRRASPLPVRI